jgi:hypothetical protein
MINERTYTASDGQRAASLETENSHLRAKLAALRGQEPIKYERRRKYKSGYFDLWETCTQEDYNTRTHYPDWEIEYRTLYTAPHPGTHQCRGRNCGPNDVRHSAECFDDLERSFNYPPPPTIPEAVTHKDCPKYKLTEHDGILILQESWAEGWNACREAMLAAQQEKNDVE